MPGMMGPGAAPTAESSALAILEVVGNPEKYKALIEDLQTKSDALSKQDADVSNRTMAIVARENAVSQAEAELTAKIASTEAEINTRAAALVQRESKVAFDAAALTEQQTQTQQEWVKIRKRTSELDTREADLSTLKAMLDGQQAILEHDQKEIERKKAVLAQL